MQIRPCEYTLITGLDISDQVTLALQNGAVLHGQTFVLNDEPAQAVVYLGHFSDPGAKAAEPSSIVAPPEKKVIHPV